MEQILNHIVYDKLFQKYPVISKIYNYSKDIKNIQFFKKYRISMSSQIQLYPVGIYKNKLIYLSKDNDLNCFYIDQIAWKFAENYMIKIDPQIKFQTQKLQKTYIRLFPISEIQKQIIKDDGII